MGEIPVEVPEFYKFSRVIIKRIEKVDITTSRVVVNQIILDAVNQIKGRHGAISPAAFVRTVVFHNSGIKLNPKAVGDLLKRNGILIVTPRVTKKKRRKQIPTAVRELTKKGPGPKQQRPPAGRVSAGSIRAQPGGTKPKPKARKLPVFPRRR
jgi:hypothetical protein